MRLVRFSREEFIKERFHYKAGEHLTSAAPTGDGKTELCLDLQKEVAKPTLPVAFLMMKPKDETVDRLAPGVGLKEIKAWPPPWWQTQLQKPNGWVLRPPFTFDPELDEARQYVQFRRAILWCYRKGNVILDADEAHGLVDLGLERELKHVWQRGRSQGCGLWAKVQKPTHVPLWAYNCAEHLLLGPDPDERNIKKFTEFGGVDPRIIWDTIPELGDFEHLYLRRRGRVACIVEAR